uniref:Uncharacterized protein n=1 Tax=Lepeophtheirus salmonis TaxID=72036 RepID=A0A0K2T4J4_LEPSM
MPFLGPYQRFQNTFVLLFRDMMSLFLIIVQMLPQK